MSKEERVLLDDEKLADVAGGFDFGNENTEPLYKVGDIFLSDDGETRFEITRIGDKEWPYGFRYFGNQEALVNGTWCRIWDESSFCESTLQFWSRIN